MPSSSATTPTWTRSGRRSTAVVLVECLHCVRLHRLNVGRLGGGAERCTAHASPAASLSVCHVHYCLLPCPIQVLPTALRGAFQSCGQNCAGAERFIVHEKVFDEFVR